MEIEAKYRLTPEELKSWRLRMQGEALRRFMAEGSLESRDMHSYYFDDVDRSLSRSKACLRLRLENGTSVLTVKASLSEREGRSRRHEWEWHFPEAGTDWLERLPALPAFALDKLKEEGEKDAELAACLARFHLASAALLTEVQFVRQLRLFRCGRACIEWALDEGSFLHAGHALPFMEMEAELKAGEEKDLLFFLDELRAFGELKPESRSKLERALRVAEQDHGQ